MTVPLGDNHDGDPVDLPDDLEALSDIEVATLLEGHIGYISEETHFAGWLLDIEYDLWRMSEGELREWGMVPVAEEDIVKLRRLRERLRGAWVWWESGVGAHYVTAEEWVPLYEAWFAKRPVMVGERMASYIWFPKPRLIRVWKKPGDPLPLEQRQCDTLYYDGLQREKPCGLPECACSRKTACSRKPS